MATKLQEHYEKTVRPKLMAEFKYANQLQAPRIEKIVVNMGVGEGTQDAKKVDAALGDLAKITGQRPVKTKSTKAIADDKKVDQEERFAARLKLAELPRNSSRTRIRNRCELTGRPRAVYRKFKLSRIALRELASTGQIPGMVKSSW